jgi:ribose 5-phosphate isomerase B
MAPFRDVRVYLGSDHAGFELKAHLVEQLGERGYEVVDHGPVEFDPVDDYPTYELKTFLAEHLISLGHDVVDVGPHVFDPDDDYPPFCIETARRVVANSGSLGVVIGGSGNGEQISANKVKGCRAALAWSTETATLAREHNDAQVVGIGARMHSQAEAAQIVEAFLNTAFTGGERHRRRIRQIAEYEATGEPLPLPGR